MSAIAPSPEQFIFASDTTLKTTSLKIAERFGKRHDNVIRDIDKVLTQVSDIFGKLNFEETEYEKENNLGLMTKYRSFNLTQDGFMIVVMGFTGKTAMEIKEWYITAFNLMREKLFPVTQYGLKQLEAPRAKKAVKGGLLLEQQDQINDLIKERLLNVPQERKAAMAIRIYSAINTKFDTKGMKDGYKNITPEHFDNIILLIARLPLDEKELLTFAPLELAALIKENINRAKVGELLQKQEAPQYNSITINLAPLNADRRHRRWLVTQALDEMTILMQLDLDQHLQTREQSIEDLISEGYIVIKKSDVISRLEA